MFENSVKNSSPTIVAVVADSAWGKTTLAITYAYQYKEQYHHRFFIDAKNWRKEYEAVAMEWKLFLNENITTIDNGRLISSIHSVFSKNVKNKRSLIILDNFETIQPELKSSFIGSPFSSRPDILLLSKSEDTLNLAKDKIIDLQKYPLTKEEGNEILSKQIGYDRAKQKDALNKILQELDSLSPMTYKLVGNYLKGQATMTLDTFLQIFEKTKSKIVQEGKFKKSNDKHINLITFFFMYIEEVAKKNSEAAELLYSISYLPSKNIPFALLSKLCKSEEHLESLIKALDILVQSDKVRKSINSYDFFSEIMIKGTQYEKEEKILSKLGDISGDFQEFLKTDIRKADYIKNQKIKERNKIAEETNKREIQSVVIGGSVLSIFIIALGALLPRGTPLGDAIKNHNNRFK